MGVRGLWRLLLPIGRRISIETLEGKILAIDASIWLTQFLKAMRDPDSGNVRPAAHLIGFFRRLCKLRFQGIRPVFVFDGATPEIKQRELRDRRKRREQFTQESGDATQRMAKRLLAQQLKKNPKQLASGITSNGTKNDTRQGGQKNPETGTAATVRNKEGNDTTTGSSSYAPGFYDPQMKEEKPAPLPNHKGGKEDVDSPPSDEESTDLLKEDTDYLKVATDRGNAQSDWDTAVTTPVTEEEEKAPFGGKPKSKQQTDLRKFTSAKFDVDFVASLPSTQRKDLVEDAQRGQRLQSRREFMNVASDMEGLSKCQLRNFLRSTKLNKDIHQMARKAAQSEGLDTTAAGDRSRRIIFEVEGDSSNFGGRRQQATQRIISKYADKKKLSVLDSDSDDDALFNSTSDSKEPAGALLAKPKAIVDSDSDEEMEGGGFFQSGSGHGDAEMSATNNTTVPLHADPGTRENQLSSRLTGQARKHQGEQSGGDASQVQRDEELARSIQYMDDDDGGGGFFPSEGETKDIVTTAERRTTTSPGAQSNDSDRKMPAKTDEGLAQEMQDEDLARAIQDANDTEEEDYGGGFLVAGSEVDDDRKIPAKAKQVLAQDENLARAMQNASPDGSEEENYGGGFLPAAAQGDKGSDSDQKMPAKTDEVLAQELQDENMARALQNARPHNEGGFLPHDFNDGSDRKMPAKSDEVLAQELQDEDLARALDEDKPDSGEEKGGDASFLPTSRLRVHPKSTLVSLVAGSNPDANDNGTKPTETEKSPTESAPLPSDDSDEDDDVDWEDGDEATEQQDGQDGQLEQSSDEQLTTAALGHPGATTETPLPMQVRDESSGGQESDSKVTTDSKTSEDAWEKSRFSRDESQTRPEPARTEDGDISLDDEEVDALPDNANPWENGGDGLPGNSSTQPKEVAAALEHAQTTAANLTNWAGRAFRLAIAQHAQENGLVVPDAVKAKVGQVSTTKDEDTVPPNAAVVNQKALKTPPQPTNTIAPKDHSPPPYKLPSVTNDATSKDAFKWPDAAAMEKLEAYQEKWEEERNQKERDMDTVTDEMRADVMQLLQLFGVPYVEAPAEAEAQCVMLEKLKLVHGIVTEDSDAFVFGGKCVYKNIFDDQKYVEVYNQKDAEDEMNISTDGMVGLAMLLGGDYTEGVKGVGIVNGMEILHAFNVSDDVQDGLLRFRKWLDGFDPSDVVQTAGAGQQFQDKKERYFHRKHHTARTRWVAPKFFPDQKVLTAYQNPVVDKSEERFSWGVPDLERLIIFCQKHVGWTVEETRKLLEPVVQKIEARANSKMHQTRLDAFLRYEDGVKFADVRSKRLREVLSSSQTADKAPPAAKRPRNKA